MKLESREIAGFLRNPGTSRLALIFGEDEGLIRERGQALTSRVAGSLDDPFLVTELTREGWTRMPAEMAALSMVGGRRVVLVRDATDAALPHVVEAMKTAGAAMLILEAAGLPKGKLRSFAEASPESVAFGCYVEEGLALSTFIRGLLAESAVTIEDQAVEWLGQNLGPGRSAVRGEIAKLVLFVGSSRHLTMEAVQFCIGEQAGEDGDGMIAALLGQRTTADGAVEKALADGIGGVGVIRTALMLLLRLHQARLRIEEGYSAGEAMRLMRPPVFRKAMPAVMATLQLWSADSMLRCIELARRAEFDCKQTASRPDLLARRFVADLARSAKSQSRARHIPSRG